MRRLVRITGLLAVISLIGAFRVARSRRRLLAGLVLAALVVILRDSLWGVLFWLAFLLYLPPWSPQTTAYRASRPSRRGARPAGQAGFTS